MPLIHFENISENECWGFWEITEKVDELKAELDIYSEEKFNEITHPVKQREWLAGRLIAKRLMEKCGAKFQGVYCDGSGKPFLQDCKRHISITHSFPYAAVALHNMDLVGIDLEKPSEKMRKVAKRFLSDEELEFSASDLTKLGILWCAKEALYKFYGERGLVFREDILINPFEVSSCDHLKGRILKNGIVKDVSLMFRIIKGFVVVVTL